jgi:hypothetical protein
VGLGDAFRQLETELTRLEEAFSALQVTIFEDRPLSGETMLVDRFGYAVMDSIGPVQQALSMLRTPRRAVISLASSEPRNNLLLVHRSLLDVACRYRDSLAAYDSIQALRQFGREKGREWLSWTSVVKDAIDRCAAPLDAAHEAVRRCWEEGTESAASFQASPSAAASSEPSD